MIPTQHDTQDCSHCGEIPLHCECMTCPEHGVFQPRGRGWRQTSECPDCAYEAAIEDEISRRKDERRYDSKD